MYFVHKADAAPQQYRWAQRHTPRSEPPLLEQRLSGSGDFGCLLFAFWHLLNDNAAYAFVPTIFHSPANSLILFIENPQSLFLAGGSNLSFTIHCLSPHNPEQLVAARSIASLPMSDFFHRSITSWRELGTERAICLWADRTKRSKTERQNE
jgi:hypothetical protein